MLAFLYGIPGKIKVLNTRLGDSWAGQLTTIAGFITSSWASKLDSLRTGLTDTRMQYLDKLNITGNVASAADIANAASLDSPLDKPPIANALDGTTGVTLAGGPFFAGVYTTQISSTSYTNVVNYTGEGVINFAALYESGSYIGWIKITIDGVQVAEVSAGPAANSYVSPIGVIGSQYLFGLDHISFKYSLVIQ